MGCADFSALQPSVINEFACANVCAQVALDGPPRVEACSARHTHVHT